MDGGAMECASLSAPHPLFKSKLNERPRRRSCRGFERGRIILERKEVAGCLGSCSVAFRVSRYDARRRDVALAAATDDAWQHALPARRPLPTIEWLILDSIQLRRPHMLCLWQRLYSDPHLEFSDPAISK